MTKTADCCQHVAMCDPSARRSAQEEFDAEVLPGDAALINVTAYLATKIAGIIEAAAQGHAASEDLAAISKYLHAVSIEAKGADLSRLASSIGTRWTLTLRRLLGDQTLKKSKTACGR